MYNIGQGTDDHDSSLKKNGLRTTWTLNETKNAQSKSTGKRQCARMPNGRPTRRQRGAIRELGGNKQREKLSLHGRHSEKESSMLAAAPSLVSRWLGSKYKPSRMNCIYLPRTREQGAGDVQRTRSFGPTEMEKSGRKQETSLFAQTGR